MGVGDPLEAPYTLTGPLPAGSYHLIGDGEIIASADVQFDVIWRAGTVDTTVVSFTHHFDAPPSSELKDAAVLFDGDATGVAIPAKAGDLLVLRFSITSQAAAGTKQYIPNGDGSFSDGRIPQLWIPTATQ